MKKSPDATSQTQEQTTEPNSAWKKPEPFQDAGSSPRSSLRRAWMYGALAMELTAGVVGGSVTGYFLDQWKGTSPWWTLILLLVGLTGGFVLMLRGLSRLESESE